MFGHDTLPSLTMSLQDEIQEITKQLRDITSVGLRTAPNEYHVERYEQMLMLSRRMESALERRRSDKEVGRYEGDFSEASPSLVANAAVFRDGQVLLIKRGDNGRWALPGGLTEVGETWAESAQRELLEEAGVRGNATKLLAVFDRSAPKTGQHLYIAVFLVEVPADEEPKHDGAETTDVGFFPVDDLPNVGATSMIPTVVKLAHGGMPAPYFHPGPR